MIGPQLRTTFKQTWWLPFLCFGLAFALSRTESVRQAEWKSLDWRTEFRTHFQDGPDSRLVLVFFDDQTESLLEKPWPVDRLYHAQLTQVLALAGAKMVAWDVILDASREGEGDPALGQMAAAAIEAGTHVLSAGVTSVDPTGAEPGKEGPTRPLKAVEGDIALVVGDEHAFLPYLELRATSLYGFADTPPGSDGVRREVPMVVRVGKELYPGLSLQILLAYFDVKADDVRVRLGDAIYFEAEGRPRRVPIDRTGRLLLNYRFDLTQRPTDFAVYNYGSLLFGLSEVFLEEKTPQVPPPDMKERIVIVGQTVSGKADAGPSPLNGLAPLSFVIANAVNNVLADDYARPLPPGLVWPLVGLLAYAGMLLLAHRSVWLLCSGAVLGLVAYSSLAVWLWVGQSWWLAWVAPLAGVMLLQFAIIGRRIWLEQKAKLEIKGMFGAYVSPQVVDRLVKSGKPPQLGGHVREITAYFSDIRGFSTFSEKLPPDRLVELMNEYLTVCTDIIQEEGGTLDKYIGDAVVAMFGAPVSQEDHAYRACVASQRVQRKLLELREKWRGEGAKWPTIVHEMETRIGLNGGPCVIGNMGSRTRFNYTMMGDDVNLAARMESGAKTWGARTMCTEATKLACEKHGGDRVVFRPLGRIVVKGRTQAVPLYEVMGLREWVDATTFECCAVFGAGLERYFAREWDAAETHFKRCLQLEPRQAASEKGEINPSLVYIELIETHRLAPPSPEWTGVYVMTEK